MWKRNIYYVLIFLILILFIYFYEKLNVRVSQLQTIITLNAELKTKNLVLFIYLFIYLGFYLFN